MSRADRKLSEGVTRIIYEEGTADDAAQESFRDQIGVFPSITTTPNVALFGDSMIAGAGAQIPFFTQWRRIQSRGIVFNGGVGGETSTQIKDRYLAATSQQANPLVIWSGRNNFSSGTTVKSDIAAMVAAHTSARSAIGLPPEFMVVSILNGNGTSERMGGVDYNLIIQLNLDLASIYGGSYVDVRAYIVSQYNPSIPQDVTDHGFDVPPSSLRIDGLHLNTAGIGLAADYIFSAFRNAYPVPDGFVRLSDLDPISAYPFDVTGIERITGILEFRNSAGEGVASLTPSGSGNTILVTGGLIGGPSVDLGLASAAQNNRFRTGYFSTSLYAPEMSALFPVGTNLAGTDLMVSGGPGTGTGAGGVVKIGVAAAGSSGTAVNARTEVARFDLSATAGDTRFLLFDVTAGSLKRVSVGAADSGGSGFKVLRVPN